MKKIDIHCHTTPRQLNDAAVKDASLARVLLLMDTHDIRTTVLLATYFPHRGSGISNYRLLHMLKGNARFTMFGSLDMEHYFYQGYNELEELAAAGNIKGIKLYTCYQHIDLKSDRMEAVAKLARSYKLPLMFHCGYSYSARRTTGKIAITEPVKASDLEHLAEGNTIIVSHLAKPFHDDLLGMAKKWPDMYADMSGLIDSRTNRNEIDAGVCAVRSFVDTCGPHKLLFGTDFPVQTHEDSIRFIEQGMQGYWPSEVEMVYYDNARRLLHYE